MSTDDTTKLHSRLSKLDSSLDELESQLEPLFAQSLHKTLHPLDTIQQAKLQTIIPYVVYDLVFIYLKSRGIDPKTHRVVAELERIRHYFDKIKHAEESDQKRKMGIDKTAAGRFIKHAIAQAKNAQLVDEPSDPGPSSSSSHERVPLKVTSKMLARAEYEKELKELGSEEEEVLEVFDEEVAVEEMAGPSEATTSTGLDKGKGRAAEQPPKRPRLESVLSVSESLLPTEFGKKARHGTKTGGGPSREVSDDRETKATKRGKRKARKP